jgi:hypothetical protein
VISCSTPPPEAAGFPVAFGLESSSHCAVGDVDGDGQLNIVLGADRIYVWNPDGTELRDGDDDPSTSGPINGLVGQFDMAGITLADLDGLPGLEIIASERQWSTGDQNAVHIIRGDGSALPGWPQQLRPVINGWNWATPAVGDVDGDGDHEIVVNTLDGRTWVWHHDGSELRDGDNDPSTNGVFMVRVGWDQEWGMSSPALFDLDGDEASEIIFGTRYGNVQTNYLLAYRYDGLPPNGFPYATRNGSILCSPTVADLNQDDVWEIIFLAQDDLLYVVQQNGVDYPGFPVVMTCNTMFTPSPAVGDFDSDDDLEIVAVATTSGELAHIYVIDTDIPGGNSGSPLSGWPQPVPGSSEASPVVGDLDGDGMADLLHGIGGGSVQSPNRVYGFKGSGESLPGFPIALDGPVRSSAFICDLDGDGNVDIVQNAWDRLLHVWDMPSVYNEAMTFWPTFRGHVHRDGVYRPWDLTDVAVPLIGSSQLLVTGPYPNPFNPLMTARLYLPGAAGTCLPLTVEIYDLQGRRVRVLHDGAIRAGWHTWIWDGRDANGRQRASGIYFLRAQSEDQLVIKKMSLIK